MKRSSILLPFLLIFHNGRAYSRSIYRPVDRLMPEITTHWVGDDKEYHLRNYYLEEYSLFKLFDKDFFEKHLLPKTSITYRYSPNDSVGHEKLTYLIEQLLQEIESGKKKFTHFTILQSKDYNFKKKNGLLILKFNDYPFVVKLFIENPKSFVDPFNKGMEPIFCFFMAGGINRHLLGFTRLKNKEIIERRLALSPWNQDVDMPRKWHWIPANSRWIEIHGKNFGSDQKQSISFPGTYCIIADAIEAERMTSLFNEQDTKKALAVCNYLDLWIDPHMKNFMIEKGSKKFIIVDTEHFPSFTGLREKVTFTSYGEWYLYLAQKCLQDAFFRTKSQRRNSKKPNPSMSLVLAKL